MINVTKLNGSELLLNADLIETVEVTPDTLISLTTGRKYMVRETMEEIVSRTVDYSRRSRSHPVPAGGQGSVFEGAQDR